jgi:hypothetical protein
LWENGTAFYGLGNDTNRLAFYASNAAGTAERMVLTSDGNVGIGTTAPINEFHVAVDGAWGGASSSLHSIITSNDGDNGIGIYSGNTKNGYIRFGDTDSQSAGGFNYDHNDNSLKIRTAGTDRWKMDSIGRIQCGNSTSFGGTLGYLNVKGLSNTRGFQVYQPTTSTTAGQYMGFSNVGGTQTNVSKIESNGDFQSATNSYGSLSDERLKTIEPARDYLADLQKLEVKNFRLTSNFVPTQVTVTDDEGNETTEEHPTEGAFVERDEADYSPKQLGLIAQQVEEHIPGLVKEDDYGVKALRYSVLVPMLLQAVQTLTARIETLETA